MSLNNNQDRMVNDSLGTKSDEANLEQSFGAKTRKMRRNRFMRRNIIKTGLIGAGLYALEKSVISPVRAIAFESSEINKDNHKFPTGLQPTINPTKSGFVALNQTSIANEIKDIQIRNYSNKEAWIEAWQALDKIIEVNNQFVERYNQESSTPESDTSKTPIGSIQDFFDRASQGQNPIGVILGCVDSRVHYERRLGLKEGKDMPAFFIQRSIGNVVNPYNNLSLSATLQYNLEGIKRDVIVCIQMVHQKCGMVSATASGTAFELGGSLEKAAYLIKPAVEPNSRWKKFVIYWPNQTESDVNVMANGLLQLSHLFAGSEYLKQKLRNRQVLPILGYVPLDNPQVSLFKLPPKLLDMYGTMKVG